jgi:hypothetical protein
VVFLDLTLTINAERTIETKAFAKPKNLYLYTPANSAHPPGCFKGIIFGNIIPYWNQNINIKYYTELFSKLSDHLQVTGHDISEVEAMMQEAAAHIDSRQKTNTKEQQQQNEPTQKK